LGQARFDEAMECFRRALDLRPNCVTAHDGLLLILHYRAGVTPQQIAAAHDEYQCLHAAPLRAAWQAFTNDRKPERPLRLGFVSPASGGPPVGYFFVRAAGALARRAVVFACYSDRRAPPDELTERFRAAASLWRDTAGLTDEQLAEQVRADR